MPQATTATHSLRSVRPLVESRAVKVGVLGGTFDPIHNGHLVAAEEARVALGLDRVLFAPAAQNPLKGARASSAEDRAAMVVLAIADNPAFALSRVDLDRPGPSYTVDTLAVQRAEMAPQDELFFILGYDSLAELPRWHQPRRLLELAVLVGVTRPGWERLDVEALERALPGARERIRLLPIPYIGTSSTDLRRRVREGRPIRYQVPDAVERFVRQRGLYQQPVEQRP